MLWCIYLLSLVFADDDCDMEFDMPFCSYKGPPMSDPALLETLKIRLSFKDLYVVNLVDKTEYEVPELSRGPSMRDDEYSGYFTGKQIIEIEQNDQNPYFTYAMWVFFPRTSGIEKPRTVCPIFHKGTEETQYPSLYFDQKHRQFHLSIDLTVQKGVLLKSASRVQFNQWLYIGVVSTSSKAKLYINGILDNILVYQSALLPNQDALYVGNTPWLKDSCSMPYLLDKFQFYSEEIKAYFLQAQSQGFIEQASLHFGCVSCAKEEAKGACISGYHLCTKLEVYSGVYNIARSLGWIEYGDFIWTYNDAIRNTEDRKGLAICCID